MAVFGKFETVEELASSGPYSVWSARRVGESGPARAAVKTLRTQDMLLDEAVLNRRAAEFLDAAQVMGMMSQEPNWAPLHESGRTDSHVYYATDLFAGSVQKLIDSRRDLSAREMVALLRGVLRGVGAMRDKAGGRAHGKLRASNVLLAAGDELVERSVFLADPAPASSAPKDASTADLRALGALLFEIVTHRAAPKGGGDVAGPEWKRLKKAGEPLRHICESLINVRDSQAPTVPALLEQLGRVPTSEGMPAWQKAVAASVLVVVLGGGGYVGWRYTGGGAVLVDQRLPNSQEWMRAEIEGLEAKFDKFEQNWGVFPSAAEDVARVETAHKALSTEYFELKNMNWSTRDDGSGGTRPATREEQMEMVRRVSLIAPQVAAVTKSMDDAELKFGQNKVEQENLNHKNYAPQNYMKTVGQVTTALAVLEAEGGTTGSEGAEKLKTQRDAFEARYAKFKETEQTSETTPFILGEIRGGLKTACDELGLLANGQKSGSEQRLNDFVDAQRRSLSSGEVQAPDVLLNAYRAVLDGIDPKLTSAYDWKKAKSQVAAGREWLTTVAADLPAKLKFAPAASSTITTTEAQKTLDEQVSTAVEQLAGEVATKKEIPALNDPAYAKLRADTKQRLQQWIGETDKVFADAAQVETLLNDGYGLDEAGSGGASISALATAVAASPRIDQVRSGVSGVLTRAESLRTLGSSTSVADLKRAMALESELSSAITAWKRLPAAGYPATLADLTDAPAMYERAIASRLKGVSAARRDAIEPLLREALPQMWLVYVNERAGTDAANVEGAFALAGSFNIGDAQLATLAPHAKLNRARMAFAKSITGISNPDAQAEFLDVKRRLGEFWNSPEASAVASTSGMQQLRGSLAMFMDKDKWVNLEEEGPGKAGWQASVRSDGAEVVYRWNGAPGGRPHVVVFRRVGEGLTGSNTASYVATTEVPLGLFVDVIAAQDKWEEASGSAILNRPDMKLGDLLRNNWAGPRPWRWSSEGTIQLTGAPANGGGVGDSTGNGWLMPDSSGNMASLGCYPPGVQPAAPSAATPITYISPEAAIYVARLINCRVPSSGEFIEAIKQDSGAGANRRDGIFARTHDHVRQLQPQVQNKAQWPNGGVFSTDKNASPETDGAAAVQGDDGELWFRPVAADLGSEVTRFADLVGNVAEYVFEKPELLDQMQPATLADRTNDVRKGGRPDVRVIGSSALSPASIEPRVPNKPAASTNYNQGFSDVGFRLAFSTGAGGGSGTPAKRLQGILAQSPYLTGTK